MTIEIIPNIGFVISGIAFHWGQSRIEIRKKLNDQHKEDDSVIEMSEFFDGDTSYDINQRRDIYENIETKKNFFFLNYDDDENLDSLEIHCGISISIKSIKLIFETDIEECLTLLKSIDEKYKEIEDGNYLFQNLKISIATSESLGGEGNGLSYFFTSKNIEHLIE